VMADQLGRSVGDMYEGAFIPGIVLAALYALYVFLVGVFNPKAAPGLPPEAQTLQDADGQTRRLSVLVVTVLSGVIGYLTISNFTKVGAGADFVVLTMTVAVAVSFVIAVLNKISGLGLLSRMAEQTVFVMVPPLGLIFLVLGTIFIGLATPTEGGAMGAAGAMLLAIAKRRLSWELVRQATESTAKLSAFVVFILVGARVFSLTFFGVSGHVWVEHLLTSLPGGQVGFLIFVNLLIFILAFFLDFFELAFIAVPLIGPVADKLGIDLIWFGVMLGVNMQTSFMHPPFGFALFYLRSVAPREAYKDRVTGATMEPVTTGQIYWGAVPFVVIQLIMVALVLLFPSMVMHYKNSGPVVDQKKAMEQLDNLTPKMDDAPPTLDFGTPPKIQ
jgi:TRAP-type mannitol/chloroaromatic compound transport system permease large subunit